MDSSKRPHSRENLKEQLVPPGGGPAPIQTGRRKALLTVVVLFALLLGGALGVLLFQPADKTPPVSTAPPPEKTPAASPPAAAEKQLSQTQQPENVEPESTQQSEPAQEEVADGAAAQAREQFWTLKIEAEAQGVSSWGPEEYGQIMARLKEADAVLSDGAVQDGAERYQNLFNDLQTLLDSKEQRYRQALAAGQRGLTDEQPGVARDNFNRALVIEPASREAQKGVEQAEKLAGTLTAYHHALELEEMGQLEEALVQLETIINSSSPYEPARAAHDRIQDRLNQVVFEGEMSSLFSALEAEDFSSAQRSLQTLENLSIHLQEVEQAAALLAEKQRRSEINRLKEQAEGYRAGEQWQQALETYKAILLLDADLLFATAGQQESARRAELDASLSDAVERSHRLQDTTQRSAAASLLSFAKQIEPQGPRLRTQIEALETQLEKFSTPVTVVIESDNQTHITIYHVGRIAPFFSTKIDLQPGTYTVVGSRAGYRDVRKQIIVAPENSENRYEIRCEEAI